MYVAGSVHLSPPFWTSDSRTGQPIHSAVIGTKYAAGSFSVNWRVLSSTALTPT
jgi:hypothetical protein